MKFAIIKSCLARFSGIFAVGTPSNIHGTAIRYRCAKFGTFVNSVTILTLRDLTIWVFLNTLKYPKMEICYFFLCIRKFLELHCGHKNSISLDSDLPKKRPTHNVFEVTASCRTRADILKPTLDSRTLAA